MDTDYDRRRVSGDGKSAGVAQAEQHHPYLVLRSVDEVLAKARKVVDAKLSTAPTTFTDNKEAYKELYINGYIKGYFDKIAEMDKKAVVPSTAPSSVQGATLTLKQVERKANEYVYYIELADPGHIDGVQTAEVVYPLGEIEPAQAFASAGYAVSASDSTPSYKAIVPLPASQQTKSSRLYVRNVKKK